MRGSCGYKLFEAEKGGTETFTRQKLVSGAFI